MNLMDTFKEYFDSSSKITNDFSLVECTDGIMIGIDKNSKLSVVIKSKNPHCFPIMQKTRNMSIECNMKVTYTLGNQVYKDNVHIIRCLEDHDKEKQLFLELVDVLIREGDNSQESIMETFNTLKSFFSDKKEISDNELIGLYAELYTICHFHEKLNIENFWQSRDRMKFDFSISDKVKLEVKATTKNTRTHHFRHEQLMTELYDIYVLSFMLRYDDEGLPLFDLIEKSKEVLILDSRKLIKINTVIKNTSEERLKNLKFNNDYTISNMHFYKATDIPKFNQFTPSGVSNAEYDCVLDNVKYFQENEFVTLVINTIGEKDV